MRVPYFLAIKCIYILLFFNLICVTPVRNFLSFLGGMEEFQVFLWIEICNCWGMFFFFVFFDGKLLRHVICVWTIDNFALKFAALSYIILYACNMLQFHLFLQSLYTAQLLIIYVFGFHVHGCVSVFNFNKISYIQMDPILKRCILIFYSLFLYINSTYITLLYFLFIF